MILYPGYRNKKESVQIAYTKQKQMIEDLKQNRLEREAAKDGASENDNITDNSFIEALENSVESTWDDYDEQEETENE